MVINKAEMMLITYMMTYKVVVWKWIHVALMMNHQMKKLTGSVIPVTTNDQDMIGTLHSLACHEATALPSLIRTIVLTILMIELP